MYGYVVITDFRDFDAFEKMRAVVKEIAKIILEGAFRADPVLIHQLRKSMLSVYANFSEGFERNGNREFLQFVSIAKGSLGEIRGHLLYALDTGLLTLERWQEVDALSQESARYFGGLMRHLAKTSVRGSKFRG
jgi:four helix bundle protein